MKSFLESLRCPISKKPLRMITDQVMLAELRQSLPVRELAKKMGDLGTDISFLINPDDTYVYPVFDQDIFCLLADHALSLKQNLYSTQTGKIEEIKFNNRKFYDSFGWEKEQEDFEDAKLFEDLREVSKDYIIKCRKRINGYLKEGGKYLVDVASGPVQYDEYLEYSEKFEKRVCVDFSIRALVQAKKKLGNKGLYVLGDITNMPFRDDTMDAVISLHTIYHVPKEEQPKAFHEIYRILQPQKQALVVYSWSNHALINIVTLFPSVLAKRLKDLLLDGWIFLSNAFSTKPRGYDRRRISRGLYFYSFSFRALQKRVGLAMDIHSWRSAGMYFLKGYIHPVLFGRRILSFLFDMEEKYPRCMGRIGTYPLIVIKK